MIKAVIFDYGGVLSLDLSPDGLPKNLASGISVDDQQATKLLDYATSKFKRGLIDMDEFWRIIEKEHGQPIPEDKRDIWTSWDGLTPNEEMVAYIKTLKSKGLKVAILSNVFPNTEKIIRENGGYDGYNVVILSSEVGYAKPDPEIYQMTLDQLMLKPQECIFIDDQQYCLDAAASFGIKTVPATSPKQVMADCDAIIDSSQ